MQYARNTHRNNYQKNGLSLRYPIFLLKYISQELAISIRRIQEGKLFSHNSLELNLFHLCRQ